MPSELPAIVRSWAREPAVPDPPERVWRDWAIIAVASVTALLEATLRTDDEWVALPLGWRIAAVVVFFAALPPALLWRRTRPLAATACGFGLVLGFSIVLSLAEGRNSGLTSTVVILIVPYALYRWGSGRHGAIGLGVLLAAWFIGNLTTPNPTMSEWIGGLVVLSLPVLLGLMVRYGRAAKDRAWREAQALERASLARELHDTVAHHVSAIAVQAQAARAVAATDPDRAFGILGVIEEQASRTLVEMRAIVGTLRAGEAELAPQQSIADLHRLSGDVAGALRVSIDVDPALDLSPAVGTAIYRIAQESVTNAVRHAHHATGVEVTVRADAEAVLLDVHDDGQAAGIAEPGYGLTGMAERTHLLGGTFSAGPASGGGWRVRAVFPTGSTGPRHPIATGPGTAP